MATGQNIKASEFNAIRDKVEQILGTGGSIGGDRGYGQALLSWPAVVNNTFMGDQENFDAKENPNVVTRDQWNALKKDILNVRLHQTGVISGIAEPTSTEPIRYGSAFPNTNYDTLINQSAITRFNVGTGRAAIRVAGIKERTTQWSNLVSTEITVDFPGFTRADGFVVTPLNHARSFFNSGGKIRILSSRTGGSPSAQNTSWTGLLVSAAAREIAAYGPERVGFYTLTNSYQLLYELSASGPYASNKYRIEAKCDVADNQTATATKVFIRVSFIDSYVDEWPLVTPPDRIDGTLKVTVEEFKASGSIFQESDITTPTGTWLMPSPNYSITDISGS